MQNQLKFELSWAFCEQRSTLSRYIGSGALVVLYAQKSLTSGDQFTLFNKGFKFSEFQQALFCSPVIFIKNHSEQKTIIKKISLQYIRELFYIMFLYFYSK